MTNTFRSTGGSLRRGILSTLAVLALLASSAPVAGDTNSARHEAIVAVNGLACPFCVYGLEKQLKRLPGAKQVSVDLGKGQAVIGFAGDARVTDAQIEKAVRRAGFSPGKIEWRSGGGSTGSADKK
ncbi:MAG: heavy metal-associated domain-containing protein [Thermoanaerobaculia bacterium]